ncbi:MAG: NAD(+) synthase [Porphyromonadaceae bacterium CG2_30_38_12]|nr:MAG: NAD(+) synthase [Porphyromonadaceae bacterium CG2_30_38_12]
MNHGFVRVAAAIPSLQLAECNYNISQIALLAKHADAENVQIVCFPELCITGYSCADLFFQQQLLADALQGLKKLQSLTFALQTVIIIGMPLRIENQLFNVAVVIQAGKLLGVVPKTHLPNNNEFYEKRWFASSLDATFTQVNLLDELVPFGTRLLFQNKSCSFAIEICEDLWVPIPPSSQHVQHGAQLIFNLSASNELIGKHNYLRQLIEQQSARCNAGYIYASAGFGESTTDVVYAGNALIAENATIIAASKRFSYAEQLVISDIDVERLKADRIRNSNFVASKDDRDYRIIHFADNYLSNKNLKRVIEKHPFVPPMHTRNESCEEIFSIQMSGLAKRWKHTNAETILIGISGGLDSTLALLVCVKTADKLGFDRKRIIGVTMPGFGTTQRTYQNALGLIHSLGITAKEISIKDACLQHFKDIEQDENKHDITYENTQARERTQILMDLANKHQGLVVGTGDLSELALGWATYNGDQMSMYGLNSGVPKTLVRYLVDWASHQLDSKSETILQDILDTPVSPELLPADGDGNIAQKTEDLVGPYELHDFFLYYFVRFGFAPSKILFLAQQAFQREYEIKIIEKWLRIFLKRFYQQQFKRSCMPDGPKVGSINLSPRGDWRMPSDAVFRSDFLI